MAQQPPQWVIETRLRIHRQAASEQSAREHLTHSHERIERSRAALKDTEDHVRKDPRTDRPGD